MPFRPEDVIVHDELEPSYDAWRALADQGRKPAKAVWGSLQVAILRLKIDAQWGKVIRQAFIPQYFREKYGVSNLYCIELADFHRCFYTLAGRSVVLLDIVDHPTYDKWFPGRRSR
jgi:hypothetical protein